VLFLHTACMQERSCPACNATWTDVFTLTGYRDLRVPGAQQEG